MQLSKASCGYCTAERTGTVKFHLGLRVTAEFIVDAVELERDHAAPLYLLTMPVIGAKLTSVPT